MTTSLTSNLPVLVSARPLTHAPRVELADSAADWDEYVAHHPRATMYHLHAWKTVAERVYGMHAPFLVARDTAGGPIRGVLPLVRVPRPFAAYLTTGKANEHAELWQLRGFGMDDITEAFRTVRQL